MRDRGWVWVIRVSSQYPALLHRHRVAQLCGLDPEEFYNSGHYPPESGHYIRDEKYFARFHEHKLSHSSLFKDGKIMAVTLSTPPTSVNSQFVEFSCSQCLVNWHTGPWCGAGSWELSVCLIVTLTSQGHHPLQRPMAQLVQKNAVSFRYFLCTASQDRNT